MGESRQELVNWVNDLLLLNVTRVEQCGTGAVFCQIWDSIHLDVPMGKVRFDLNSDYQYLNNFKVLQSSFTKYRIDRSIPVEKLVKCRFQDNLEFLQWLRRYWDANFPGQEYDPVARRKGPVGGYLGTGAAGTGHGLSAGAGGTGSRPGSRALPPASSQGAPKNIASPARRIISNGGSASTSSAVRRPVSRTAAGTAGGASNGAALTAAKDKIKDLTEENEQLVGAVDLVESERDFYFQKLRDIEVLIQTAADQLDAEGGGGDDDLDNGIEGGLNELNLDDNKKVHAQLIREIQTILYSTTDGFEIPTQEFETEETF